MITASRYHYFSAGHRVTGHENKCANLHGHNYRVTFHCTATLDTIGRVLDFSVMKSTLCDWLEKEWDHRFLLWEDDPILKWWAESSQWTNLGILSVPFNPTAENMAIHLVEVVGPKILGQSDVLLYRVDVQETRRCSASYSLPGY